MLSVSFDLNYGGTVQEIIARFFQGSVRSGLDQGNYSETNINNKGIFTSVRQASNSNMSHYYAYLKTVRSALTAAMCLQNFASQDVERHNKPEVEVRYLNAININ
jgi:hypothetical protein